MDAFIFACVNEQSASASPPEKTRHQPPCLISFSIYPNSYRNTLSISLFCSPLQTSLLPQPRLKEQAVHLALVLVRQRHRTLQRKAFNVCGREAEPCRESGPSSGAGETCEEETGKRRTDGPKEMQVEEPGGHLALMRVGRP